MNSENKIMWGERLVKMMIFFDNVRFIPENRQPGGEMQRVLQTGDLRATQRAE